MQSLALVLVLNVLNFLHSSASFCYVQIVTWRRSEDTDLNCSSLILPIQWLIVTLLPLGWNTARIASESVPSSSKLCNFLWLIRDLRRRDGMDVDCRTTKPATDRFDLYRQRIKRFEEDTRSTAMSTTTIAAVSMAEAQQKMAANIKAFDKVFSKTQSGNQEATSTNQ